MKKTGHSVSSGRDKETTSLQPKGEKGRLAGR